MLFFFVPGSPGFLSTPLCTPFSLSKSCELITEKYTDHLAIIAEVELKCIKKKKTEEKIGIINYSNKYGWKKYEEISNKYASQIINIVNKYDDPDKMEAEIGKIDTNIRIESFRTT